MYLIYIELEVFYSCQRLQFVMLFFECILCDATLCLLCNLLLSAVNKHNQFVTQTFGDIYIAERQAAAPSGSI